MEESYSGSDLHVAGDHVDGPITAGAWHRWQWLVLSRHGRSSLLAASQLADSREEVLRRPSYRQDVLVVQPKRTCRMERDTQASLWLRWIEGLRYPRSNRLRSSERARSLPFHAFWGPKAGLPSSEWIAKASAMVLRKNQPELTLVYLPHLDYDFQRLPHHDPERVAEVDRCAGWIIDAAEEVGARTIVVSEYGLVPVDQPVSLNRFFREQGWLAVRNGPYGEQFLPGESEVFAVADHQVAHLYVRQPSKIPEVLAAVRGIDGVADVVPPGDLELDHPRSGELIALAKPNAWFTYYYWFDDAVAPDFARTVDIHRKPGYDPVELFLTSMPRLLMRLAQKKLGFRYRMDVIPLDPRLVREAMGFGQMRRRANHRRPIAPIRHESISGVRPIPSLARPSSRWSCVSTIVSARQAPLDRSLPGD